MVHAVPNSPVGRNGARPRRVTIMDVARATGLTKGTVSRALNGYTDIADETRLRVKRVAGRMGYSPLTHAQAIRTGIVKSVGIVLQTHEPDAHRPFLAGFLAGISKATAGEGWTLTVSTADSDSDTLKTLDRLVQERKADGFILPRTLTCDPRIDFLRMRNVPFVLFGRTGDSTDCAWYDILGEKAIEDAVLCLHEHGHRRIAFVNSEMRYHYSAVRRKGYRSGIGKAGLDHDPTLEVTGAVSPEGGRSAVLKLLHLDRPPTAFVFAVDLAALGLYRVANEFNLRIGKEISVISYDGITEGALFQPPLTTFAVDRHEAGEELVRLLIERIRGKDPETLRKLGHARFLSRGTHGPAIRSEALAARLAAFTDT